VDFLPDEDAIDEANQPLLISLKAALPELEPLLHKAKNSGMFEDFFYRFYHQSWKVHDIRRLTLEIVETLKAAAPDRPLNAWFEQIVAEGTGTGFKEEHNQRWLQATRPILEAFFHARTFLEAAVRSPKTLEHAPLCMSAEWATLLYLYRAR